MIFKNFKFNRQSKFSIERLIILVLLFLMGYLFYSLQETKSDYKNVSKALSLADLKNQKFLIEINENGNEIAKQNQVILSKDNALKSALIEVEELKRFKSIQSKVMIETQTKIDTIYVTYDNDSVAVPPFEKLFFFKDKDYLKLNGRVDNIGVSFDEITINNKYDLIIGFEKQGLFKKGNPVVEFKSLNPYTKTTSLNNVIIDYNKPFYKKNGFWAGVGLLGGILLMK